MVEKGEYRLLKVTGGALNCRMIEKYKVLDNIVELYDVHGTLFKKIRKGGVSTTVSIYDYLMGAKDPERTELERKIMLIKYNDLCGNNPTYVWVRDKIAEELGIDISSINIKELSEQCGG